MNALETARWALNKVDELARLPVEQTLVYGDHIGRSQALYAQIAAASAGLALVEIAEVMKGDLATIASALAEGART